MSQQSRSAERFHGLLAFWIGIGLLIALAVIAGKMLTHPVPQLETIIASSSQPLKPGQPANNMAFPAVGAAIISFLLQLTVVLVLIITSSLIAGHGIKLYFAASGNAEPSPAPTSESAAPPAPPASPASTGSGDASQ